MTKIKLWNFFIDCLIGLFIFSGISLVLVGFFSLLFPRVLFHRLIIPLANMYSQTGRLREINTVEFLYREWTGFGIYMLLFLGFVLIVFSFIRRRLKNRPQEQDLANEYSNKVEEPRSTLFYTPTVIFITFIAATLRSVNLNQSLWADEIAAAVHHIRPFRLWRYLELADHWIYSFLGFISTKLFSETELVLRLPAFILGVLTIPLIYYVTKHLFSKQEGLLASALLCVSTFHIYYSNEARGYSALALFTLASSFLFLKMLLETRHHRGDGFLLGLSTALGFLSHFYYIFVLFGQYLTILSLFIAEIVTGRKNLLKGARSIQILIAMVIGFLSACVVYGPRLILEIVKKYLSWKDAGIEVSFKMFGQLFTGNQSTGICGMIFVTIIIFSLIDLWRTYKKVATIYLAFLIFLPFLIVKIICNASFTRYFIFTLPFLLILLAHAMVVIARRFSVALKIICLLGLLVTFIALQFPAILVYYRFSKAGFEDYRSAGQLIDKVACNDDVVCAIGLGDMHPQYYIKRHSVKYLSKEGIFKQIESGSSRLWLIVTFPERLSLFPESMAIYQLAQKRLKLIGYFPGLGSDIMVYCSF